MKAFPLFKCSLGAVLILLIIPSQHAGVEVKTDMLAILFDNTVWVVKEIVGINKTDLRNITLSMASTAVDLIAIGIAVGVAIGVAVCDAIRLLGDLLTNQTRISGKVEEATKLIVTSLVGIKVVETSHFVQWGNGAPKIGRDAGMGISNEKGEVKLLQQSLGDNGGISGLGVCIIGKWCTAGRLDTVLSTDSALPGSQGGREFGRLLVWRDQVGNHILDEYAFALFSEVSTHHMGGQYARMEMQGLLSRSHLRTLVVESIEDCFVSRIGEATGLSFCFVLLITWAQSLRARID